MSYPMLKPPSTGDAHAAIAAELAAKLVPTSEILSRYNLTRQQLADLIKDPQFKHMVVEFRREWHSPLNARERVKVKAAIAVEDGVAELHRLFYDPSTNASARLEAYKQLVNLADMQPKKDDHAQGPTFSLTLNLGEKTVEVGREAIEGHQEITRGGE